MKQFSLYNNLGNHLEMHKVGRQIPVIGCLGSSTKHLVLGSWNDYAKERAPKSKIFQFPKVYTRK